MSNHLLAFKCSETLTDVPVSECQALNALYNDLSIGQSSLPTSIKTSWGSATNYSVCDTNENGIGLYCDNGRIMRIDLRSSGLTGNLPVYLSQFEFLESLDLQSNQISGSIPAQLGEFSHLKNLLLGSNQLSGFIPKQLGNIDALEHLVLSDNKLIGAIPKHLAYISSLIQLSLDKNFLTGYIPSEISNMDNLLYFYVGYNQLSGPVPDITSLTLNDLAISHNCLYGLPETAQHVVDWVESFQSFAFENQNNRIICHQNNELISRNGFGALFQNRELLKVTHEDIVSDSISVNNDGFLVFNEADSWQAVPYPYMITANSTLRFTFQANSQPDINAIGFTFDIDDHYPLPKAQAFQLYGTESWYTNDLFEYIEYPMLQNFCIPVGAYFTGPSDYLVFINENETGIMAGEITQFGNYELSEMPCP